MTKPLEFDQEPSELSRNETERHEELVDYFGQFIFWIRNWALSASRNLVESEESREKIGTIRRRCYDAVAKLPVGDREIAIQLAEATLNTFLERLIWALGNEGTDYRFGKSHAYRFRVEMEIVDVESAEVVDTETINRGGRFFGKYWGRWLNRHRDK